MIISSNAVEQADRLVADAVDEVLDERVQDLMAQARTDPRRMVELVVKLSERVADVIAPPDSPAALRRAHAAYTGGDRRRWVVDGERAYQRAKKRRLRAAARAKASAA